ncbi:MAG: hypothetical protein HFF69_00455 [Oscillospiraceae bacterium]|jgi:hypothetical protein|nr:hypothetical protein [Oscillospiraceae bacterium]
MTRNEWLELTVLERKKYNCLLELEDTTRQLAEALDRNDQVAAKMLVAMRQDPLLKLEEVERGEKQRKAALPQEDQDRVRALLREQAARYDGEDVFLEQAGKTRKLLERVVELDRRISLRVAGDHSFYRKK